MEAVISLRFGNSSRIINQVAVCGIPSSAEPLFEPGEVNIHFKGRDTHVRSFLYFLVHKPKEIAMVDWKFGRDYDTSKLRILFFADDRDINYSHRVAIINSDINVKGYQRGFSNATKMFVNSCPVKFKDFVDFNLNSADGSLTTEY